MAARELNRYLDRWQRITLASLERRGAKRAQRNLYTAGAGSLRRRIRAAAHTACGRVADAVRRWRRARRPYRALAALDERMLEDLGLSRQDVERMAGGAWRAQGMRPPETVRGAPRLRVVSAAGIARAPRTRSTATPRERGRRAPPKTQSRQGGELP